MTSLLQNLTVALFLMFTADFAVHAQEPACGLQIFNFFIRQQGFSPQAVKFLKQLNRKSRFIDPGALQVRDQMKEGFYEGENHVFTVTVPIFAYGSIIKKEHSLYLAMIEIAALHGEEKRVLKYFEKRSGLNSGIIRLIEGTLLYLYERVLSDASIHEIRIRANGLISPEVALFLRKLGFQEVSPDTLELLMFSKS